MPTLTELSRDFLASEYAESPVLASSLGLTQFDEQLDDLSASSYARRARATADWTARFEGLEPESLSFDETIDRDLALANLRGRAIFDEWQAWRRHPDTYLGPGLNGIFTLFLHRLRPEAELAAAAIARLGGIPGNLAEGRLNLEPELVPQILLDRAIRQARASSRYTRELLPVEVSDERLRSRLAEAGASAADAFDEYAAFLEEMRPRAAGDWAIGEQRYSALLRDAELLSVDARALRERGRQQVEELTEELRICARDLGGRDDWHAVLAELNRDRPATPEAMRVGYEEWTARARDFLVERNLVTFPTGESCTVEPSPPFQRPVIAVASYIAPPSFAETMHGHFFVPFPPDGASEAEIGKRLESNAFSNMPTTSVHEAYPGHHWHLVMAKLNPSQLRQVLQTSYFAEGWALYAERMMREQGFFADTRHKMYQYEATLFRAARIVADTSLHLGEMTHTEAVSYMLANSSLTEPTAQAEVTRYCSWPTQASSYLTGCLEIVRIRDAFLRKRGASLSDTSDLRDFHDAITSSGTLPIALAERAVMAKA